MKQLIVLIVLIAFTVSTSCGQSVLNYVDLFICTSEDNGQLDPSATVPFGMIKPGPDTNPTNHSGYNYEADKIIGFSQNRIGGVGCSGAGGNLRILPSIGLPDEKGMTYRKDSEQAHPGYYTVQFTNQIKAELTATTQTAIHRYTFPETDNAFILIDIGSSFSKLKKASFEILNENELSASVTAKNVCDQGAYTVHYHLWCNHPLSIAKEEDKKLYFDFQTKQNEEILFYITISGISTEDARNQWLALSKDISFEEVQEKASKSWEELLSKIIVEGKKEYKSLFYTHLYHLFLNPVKTENNGHQFRAEDGKIYSASDYIHYDTWSIWDNFRNKFGLYSLIIPDETQDIAKSLTDLYRYGKPWKYAKRSSAPTVRSEHSGILLLELYNSGIQSFDVKLVYSQLKKELKKTSAKSPDKKLELCYDYWALAQFAEILGKQNDALKFTQKAVSYKSTWEKHFLTVTDNFDIMHGDGLYEGTLWQYRWHVQFDIPGMIEMIGSKEIFTEHLQYFFENHLYSHGNQPDIHVPFLFNYSSKPWLTQKWVNKILTKDMTQHYGTHEKWETPYSGRIYKAEPKGYIPEMDDDDGTMAAWYVLSSMGLYPVEVGKAEFQVTSPLFDRISIKLENGKIFEIVTKNLSENNFYIQSATLNGETFNRTTINHETILNGGKLVFQLSDKPNENWGL